MNKTSFKKGNVPWNKGKKLPQFSGEKHPMWGETHTEEAKEKISLANKGRTHPHRRTLYKWFEENKDLVKLCNCGCEQRIEIRKHHKYRGIPNYISGHNTQGIKRSIDTKKKQSLSKLGELNPMWKGNLVGFDGLHGWITRHKPKPNFCVDCKKVPPYDLANISQQYKRDVNDFEWLCRRCHMKKDGRLKAFASLNRKMVKPSG